MNRVILICLSILFIIGFGLHAADAQENRLIEQDADRILRTAGEYLKSAEKFSIFQIVIRLLQDADIEVGMAPYGTPIRQKDLPTLVVLLIPVVPMTRAKCFKRIVTGRYIHETKDELDVEYYFKRNECYGIEKFKY